MHTHTTDGLAVACTAGGLAQNNFYSAQLHGLVAYHDFEGITIHADEAPRLLKNIGDKPAVILRNHGLLSWGETLPLAFVRLWTLQRACDVQVAQAALGPAIAVPEHVAAADRGRLVPVGPALRRRARTCSTRWCGAWTASTTRTRLSGMKVCIYGAGAIGGWIGVRLAQAGCEVSVVARGATLEALQLHGLRAGARRRSTVVGAGARQRRPGRAGRAGPGGRRRQGAGDGRRGARHRPAARARRPSCSPP